MAVSDVIPQDGGQGNVKLHPYLITLVRWCVSCVWSTAGVLLQRLLAAPLPLPRLPQITAGKGSARAPGSAHLHPEPRVECEVLHAPAAHQLDVIFVHGLYGSLGNTWRQGEWRTKYKLDPTKVPLRNHSTEPCRCTQHTREPAYSSTQQTREHVYTDTQHTREQAYSGTHHTREHAYTGTQQTREQAYTGTQGMYEYDTHENEANLNESVTFKQLNGCFKKILPNENSLITEQFYNNTLLQVDVENTQAKFVSELFKNDCESNCDGNTFKCSFDRNGFKCNFDERDRSKCNSVNCNCKINEVCKCKVSVNKGVRCEAGCGCVCDDCYSHCWPRDWIKEDFPGARVISINYTSDPYLWRPLWVKGTKRPRLHERADQMIEQLLALGVGRTPIVWVGHSKGGLFIKQIYCEAYEAYLKVDKNKQSIINNNSEDQSDREYKNNVNRNVDLKLNKYKDNETANSGSREQNNANCNNLLNNFVKGHNSVSCATNGGTKLRNIDEMNEIRNNNNSGNVSFNKEGANNIDLDINCNIERDDKEMNSRSENGGVVNKPTRCNEHSEYIDISVRNDERLRNGEDNSVTREKAEVLSSNNEEDSALVCGRASLWAASSAFMFYSVPHRGSPLADIKTPLTSRSVELQEIAKDCPLVLELQARWLEAARRGRARVSSVVESGRTLMSVLWLRIVSEDSADAGVGVLHGVSVDHREICKPASRSCLLYTELTHLIRAALAKCRCQ